MLTSIDFSVGDMAKEGPRRDLMEIKGCLAETYRLLLFWVWREWDSDCRLTAQVMEVQILCCAVLCCAILYFGLGGLRC